MDLAIDPNMSEEMYKLDSWRKQVKEREQNIPAPLWLEEDRDQGESQERMRLNLVWRRERRH